MKAIKIDILEFVKTGKFACIKLGQSKDCILNNFLKPDYIGGGMQKDNIWLYGNIEFHFDDDKLFMIFSDNFNSQKLNAGNNIRLKRWIFDTPDGLSLKNVTQELNSQKIDFVKETNDDMIKLKFKSGVSFYFENHKEIPNLSPDEYCLIAFDFL